MLIRLPQFAGTFYPDNPQALKEMIGEFLDQATMEKSNLRPKAIIVPHAGYFYSGKVAAYAFKALENQLYEQIILLGSSHHFSFEGLAMSPAHHWQTPLGQAECLVKNGFKTLARTRIIIESSEIHAPEHCLEVELPFLQVVLKKFKILPLITGNLNAKQAAKILEPLVDAKTLILASSDLSHHYSYGEAQKLDKVTTDAILDNDIGRLEDFGEACGKTGIKILMAIAKNQHWQPKLLKALNSGDVVAEKNRVVGYASLIYY